MNVEPQELPAEALAMLVENPGSSLVAQLLQHVAHQDQQIATIRSELARVEGERDALVEKLTLSITEGVTQHRRVDELTTLLRVVKTYTEDLHNDPGMPRNWVMLARVDQALASAGAEKAKSDAEDRASVWTPEGLEKRPVSILVNMIKLLQEDIWCVHKWLDENGAPRETEGGLLSIIGRILHLPFHAKAQQAAADPSPGASERRTTWDVEWHDRVTEEWHPLAIGYFRSQRDAAKCLKHEQAQGFRHPWRIVRVTEIRDVIAAGEKPETQAERREDPRCYCCRENGCQPGCGCNVIERAGEKEGGSK